MNSDLADLQSEEDSDLKSNSQVINDKGKTDL